jgi:NADH-quinone oxidoreductase subunit A
MEEFGPIGAYIPLLVLLGIALGLALLLNTLSRVVGPWRPNKIKNSVYESGMDPVGSAHERFAVKFYLIAMLFILFDIEIVFMYPWAVNFKQLAGSFGLFPLIEMGLFAGILFVGYIYVWRKGGLDWNK